MAEKKNPDYSASAVMLTNPPQVMVALGTIKGLTLQITDLREKIESLIPKELKDVLASLQKDLEAANKGIREDIEEFGSYQDPDKGEYALKQKRESITYKAELTENVLGPKFASLVIVKSVDSKALDGLVKGKMITPVQARQCGEVKETYAYIVK